jgi:hypothetical protein
MMKNWSVGVLECRSVDCFGACLRVDAQFSINPLPLTPLLHHSSPAPLDYSIS